MKNKSFACMFSVVVVGAVTIVRNVGVGEESSLTCTKDRQVISEIFIGEWLRIYRLKAESK
jgi:hypothetical protein